MISFFDIANPLSDFFVDKSVIARYSNFDVKNVTNDSRKVSIGSIFFVVNEKALQYLYDVFAKNPLCIILDIELSQNEIVRKFLESDFGVLIVFSQNINIRRLYGIFVVQFYQLERFLIKIAAITGTNGKSSTAFFYKQICNFAGLKACSIGTIGIYSDDDFYKESKLTTPDISELCEIIYKKALNGIYDFAIEASSHGIDQYRIDGLSIFAAGFTNFSHDHLDYHKTIEDYWYAKSRLFSEVISKNSAIVINNDDEKAFDIKNICLERGLNYITYGVKNESDIQIIEYSIDTNFVYHIILNVFETKYSFKLNILGEFQLYNLMLAIGLFYVEHQDKIEFVFFKDGGGKIDELIAPPGRMEVIHINKESIAIVDYAHSPDALENLLLSIKQFANERKILLVFGCGGDRDKDKRPKMGAIAGKYSDFIILTDDNPRNENPDLIRSEIKSGINNLENVLEIDDRSDAIKIAISMSEKYKIIVVAGKGHEKKQIINGLEYDFDDVEIIKRLAGISPIHDLY